MNILRFLEEFPEENSCKFHFKEQRESQGIKCKQCGCEKHYWLQAKWQWQCSACTFRTTLRSGSIMEAFKAPFHTWYLAMAFMTFSKKTISSSELQRQLDDRKYDTVWGLMHKIREGMGKRDALYRLEGATEFDEGYFEKATFEFVKLKRGRGIQRQLNLAVMAESTFLEDIETGEKQRQWRYFKMKVLSDHTAETINETISESFQETSIIFSDKNTSYIDIANFVEVHLAEKSNKNTTKKHSNGYTLPLVMPKEHC